MNQTCNPKLTANAKALRRNMTNEERHLWYDFLKALPTMVHRQKVIELDGSQHYGIEGKQADELRDAYLQSLGLTVLRYSNADVNQRFSSVCQDIWNRLQVSESKPSL